MFLVVDAVFLSCLLVCFSEHLDPVNVKIAELREALESVVSEQKYLKARDTRHRHSEFSSPFIFYVLVFCIFFFP